jgi:hypothetical protein
MLVGMLSVYWEVMNLILVSTSRTYKKQKKLKKNFLQNIQNH